MMLANNKAPAEYDQKCDDYQNIEVERTNNLNNMQKIITRLLKKGNVPVGTQTDPVEGLDYGNMQGGNDRASEGELDHNASLDAPAGEHGASLNRMSNLQVNHGA